jgi:hypothetical protein
MSEHIQVASYALGLLDSAEMSRFEDHLADCDECAEQLEQMLPAVDMLADVEPGDLFGVSGLSAFKSSAGADVYPPIADATPKPDKAFWVAEEPAPTGRRAEPYPEVDGPPTTKLRTQRLRDERSRAESAGGEGFFADERVRNESYPAEPTRAERTRSERARSDRPDYDRATTGPMTGEIPKYVPLSRSGAGSGGQRRPTSSRPRSRRPESSGPPGRSRRGLLIASAAAILGVIAGAGVVTAGPWAKGNTPGITAVSDASADRLTATDPTSKVHAEVVLESKTWGTRVSFGVSDIDGPRECQLVAVKSDGQTEVLSSWNVPKQGYGKGTKPPELSLEASTALARKDIAALRVQNVSDDGSISNLVTVPTA